MPIVENNKVIEMYCSLCNNEWCSQNNNGFYVKLYEDVESYFCHYSCYEEYLRNENS